MVARNRAVQTGGSLTVNGGPIDTTANVLTAALLFDIRGISRPVMVDIDANGGDQIGMWTSTDPAALVDANHPSWTVFRAASGLDTIEFVLSGSVVGIKVFKSTDNGGASTVRLYAPQRGPGYNPVYDPNFDVAPLGLNDTRRFLDQATMGAAWDEPQALLASGDTYGDWIEAQFAAPIPALETYGLTANGANDAQIVSQHLQNTHGTEAAQLRLRTAYVLSQIAVAAHTGAGTSTFFTNSWNQRLIDVAFDNYRDVLRLTCTHKQMGFFLNNLSNSAFNINPSQNFGRELLQLFSMGTQKLNKDGSVQLDADGQPIRAYVQEDVLNASYYLAGWSQPFNTNGTPGVNGMPANGDMLTQPQVGGVNLHYNGPPIPVLGYTEVDYPAWAQISGSITDAQVRARMEAVVDAIMRQQTTGVYICKQLIQKMVTDTPSPQYIRRVVAAWENNGSGVVGDLKAIIRAILLDPEARGDSKPQSFGRAQEWWLSVTKRLRYGGHIKSLTQNTNTIRIWVTNNTPSANISREMGQWPAHNVSVFNDYPFQYEVNGVEAPAAALIRASSMLANVGRALSYSTTLGSAGVQAEGDSVGRWYCTGQESFYLAAETAAPGDAAAKRAAAHAALIDRVYADMHQGAVAPTAVRNELIGLLNAQFTAGATTVRERCVWAINAVMCCPRAAVML